MAGSVREAGVLSVRPHRLRFSQSPSILKQTTLAGVGFSLAAPASPLRPCFSLSVCLSVHGLSVFLQGLSACLPVCLHGLFPTVFAQCGVHGGLSVWHSLSVCAQSDCMVRVTSLWPGLFACTDGLCTHGLCGAVYPLHSLCGRTVCLCGLVYLPGCFEIVILNAKCLWPC